MEDFVRLRNPKCVKDLIKQLTIDGLETPRITFKLKKLLNDEFFEPLLGNRLDDVQEDVGLHHLRESAAERGDQVGREFADEPNRIT